MTWDRAALVAGLAAALVVGALLLRSRCAPPPPAVVEARETHAAEATLDTSRASSSVLEDARSSESLEVDRTVLTVERRPDGTRLARRETTRARATAGETTARVVERERDRAAATSSTADERAARAVVPAAALGEAPRWRVGARAEWTTADLSPRPALVLTAERRIVGPVWAYVAVAPPGAAPHPAVRGGIALSLEW